MDLQEVGRFLGKAALIDNRRVDELVILEWHDHLGHLDFVDAVRALNTHRGSSTEYLQPAHILKIVNSRNKVPRIEEGDCNDHVFKGGWCVFCPTQADSSAGKIDDRREQ